MSRGGLGYDLEALRAALVAVGGDATAAPPRFSSLHVLVSCVSTNDEVRRLAAAGAPAGTVVVADTQTGGRGREGRAWHSPPGVGLYASVLLELPAAGETLSRLPLLVGLAIAEAADELGVEDVAVKWPNDVLVEGRKLAGVLCECQTGATGRPSAVAGFGVNVGHLLVDFPPELRDGATSFRLALDRRVDRESVLRAVLSRLHALLPPPAAAGAELGAFPWSRWRDFFDGAGRRAAVRSAAGAALCGRVRRVDPDGALVLVLEDGQERRVVAGDVTFV